MTHEQKPESAEFRARKDQYNDPRFKRELECEIHIATGCRVTLYAEDRPTGLAQCSTYNHWGGHWSTPNWRYPVTRFVSVEEMERAVADAEARGAAEQRRKDAEGAQPLGYLVTERETGRVTFQKSPVSPEDMIEHELIVQAVYTRPANVAALETERNRWKQQAQYETDVAEELIQKASALEARIKQLEGEVERLRSREWVCDEESAYESAADALECEQPSAFEIRNFTGCRSTGEIWAFLDKNFITHEFSTEEDARNAAAAIREGGEHV